MLLLTNVTFSEETNINKQKQNMNLTLCISNVLYYHYMDLFLHVLYMFFSYLITEILILEYLYRDCQFRYR